MRFSQGQTIGRYVIESLLGEGGMGEVYQARDSKLERSVALKVQRKGGSESAAEWDHAVQRMQREAQAVAALSHPGIVAIYDIGEHEGAPFIAMELVQGRPLREIIGTDLPLSTRLRILLDVARALGAAHEAGFVHRDIKPENILVRRDGMAKILDFGIARKTMRHVDPTAATLDILGATIDSASVAMTADGALIGTPAYMSPEQLRGKTADARSDQFAWGVVAYELLSGSHPFQTEKAGLGIVAAILTDPPKPLTNIPAGVAQTITQALEKDPYDRWPSMQEIIAQCELFVTGGQVSPPSSRISQDVNGSPSQTGPVPQPPSRTRTLVVPIVGLALLSIAVFLALRSHPSPAAAPPVIPSAAPAATATATTVTDLPIPTSSNPEAISAFREGLQNIRDAQWGAAAHAFQNARTADPAMAAAHLRYAIVQFTRDTTPSREAFRKALSLRSSLSERDQGFLQALEPWIMRDPIEYGEAAQRFEKLVAKYPNDAEFVFWQARMTFRNDSSPSSLQRVIQLNTRCIELDHQYADCFQTKSNAYIALGRPEDAAAALNECINVSEHGLDCLLEEINLHAQMGRCESIVKLVQRLQIKDPRPVKAPPMLAQALYVSGESESVVRAAFLDAEEQARRVDLPFYSRMASLMLATNFGDLSTALEHATFLSRSPALPTKEIEMGLYFLRGVLTVETGKMADVAKLADEYLVAQTLRPSKSDKIQTDPTLYMRMLQVRAGKSSLADYQKMRTEWIAKQHPKSPLERAIVWYDAYAVPAYNATLAEEALKEIPADLDKTLTVGLKSTPLVGAARGRLLFLAQKYAEAIPHFERSLQICTSTEPSPWYIPDSAMLGAAREATGDKSGACEAYGRVLKRWGPAKQSETAKDVAKRAKKLGCANDADKATP